MAEKNFLDKKILPDDPKFHEHLGEIMLQHVKKMQQVVLQQIDAKIDKRVKNGDIGQDAGKKLKEELKQRLMRHLI